MATDITIVRGNSRVLVFPALDKDGRKMHLQGIEQVIFSVDTLETGAGTRKIHKLGVIEVPAAGVVTVLLTPTNTDIDPATYWYMCSVWAEAQALRHTIAKARLIIIPWEESLPT